MLSNKKNLYINGCSFVAGNRLDDDQVLSRVLSKELNLNFIDDSANGQSFGSIFTNTVSKLTNLENIEDYIVVIGLTWEPRYSIAYNKGLVNITPADIGVDPKKSNFGDKYSTWRRLTSPYYINENGKHTSEFIQIFKDIDKNSEHLNKTLSYYRDYYEALVSYDPYLKTNQLIDVFSKLITLQAFLEVNNIDYVFLDFKGYGKSPYVFNNDVVKGIPLEKLFNKLNTTRVIDFSNDNFKQSMIDKDTSHPSEKGVKFISKLIINKFNEL